jgi:hypothetical protein
MTYCSAYQEECPSCAENWKCTRKGQCPSNAKVKPKSGGEYVKRMPLWLWLLCLFGFFLIWSYGWAMSNAPQKPRKRRQK